MSHSVWGIDSPPPSPSPRASGHSATSITGNKPACRIPTAGHVPAYGETTLTYASIVKEDTHLVLYSRGEYCVLVSECVTHLAIYVPQTALDT